MFECLPAKTTNTSQQQTHARWNAAYFINPLKVLRASLTLESHAGTPHSEEAPPRGVAFGLQLIGVLCMSSASS